MEIAFPVSPTSLCECSDGKDGDESYEDVIGILVWKEFIGECLSELEDHLSVVNMPAGLLRCVTPKYVRA